VRKGLVAAILSMVWVSLVASPSTATTTPRLPSSIAALGDSMTQAFDVCCWYGNHPENSWSTGGASWDGIHSHYERILAHKPGISGHNFNDAVSGARMIDAPAQAASAVAQGAKYVTILMGANDFCRSTISAMTPVDTYRTEYEHALSTLESGLPAGAHIFVASIPNIYRLWQLFHDSSTASLVWSTANICQSMLSTSNTEADRQTVLEREEAFNAVLAKGCATYANCRFDGGAVFRYAFERSNVSPLDFFHPSLSGQAALAAVTWAASWWPSL
jgi:lysophospholipase L1-like esterase